MGQTKEISNWVNGEKTGEAISYFENGKVKEEGSWQAGKKTGNWNYYESNGKLKQTINHDQTSDNKASN